MDKNIQHWANLLKEDRLDEMARVGFFDKNKLEIYIRTDDPGNRPHFHVRDSNTHGDEFHTCIEIKNPIYFHHTGKEDVLNGKQKKSLVKFLLYPSEDYPGLTNWSVIVRTWNANNSHMKVNPELEMPDYTKL